jgi:hypothetical protein
MRFIQSFAAGSLSILRSGLTSVLLVVAPTSGEAISNGTSGEGMAVSADNPVRPTTSNGAAPAAKSMQDPKFIGDRVLINPYEIAAQSTPTHERFRSLHKERLWAVTQLGQLQSELDRLISEPHQRPVPVPEMTEVEYNAKVNDIESKLKNLETQQTNRELDESVRSAARGQLLDLTRQKARADLEYTSYRKSQQQLAAYNDVINREEIARTTIAQTLSYLTRLDEAIGNLMMTSDSESYFRLWMGGGFLLLVLVLIVCFFVVGSRSGSMREIFTNDRGLQFVTLFSLVIAITMFGLLNILEGKELSALLGGLSGYILGRSNLGGSQRQVAEQT